MKAKITLSDPDANTEDTIAIPVELPFLLRVVAGDRVLLEATIGEGGVTDITADSPGPSGAAGGPIVNQGQMSHVQTGSGTQFNVGRVTSGRDTHIGGAHH